MFNKIIIIGRLGKDPVSRNTKTGNAMCSFTVAVDSGYGDSKKTDWYSVSAFGKTAENCSKFTRKGSLVCVTGALHLGVFEGKDGTQKNNLEITADNVTFLSKDKAAENTVEDPLKGMESNNADFEEFPF